MYEYTPIPYTRTQHSHHTYIIRPTTTLRLEDRVLEEITEIHQRLRNLLWLHAREAAPANLFGKNPGCEPASDGTRTQVVGAPPERPYQRGYTRTCRQPEGTNPRRGGLRMATGRVRIEWSLRAPKTETRNQNPNPLRTPNRIEIHPQNKNRSPKPDGSTETFTTDKQFSKESDTEHECIVVLAAASYRT
jgi:hypothetical protein